MAQWKETQEPYVKVTETVRTAALNPTAGEDLIIGIALISDAGPSVPTLITSQSEFISTYSSGELTENYVKSLDLLYSGDNSTLASTMWQNAYRLAGSNNLLVCRASKGDNLYYSVPLGDGNDSYILRDGVLLKKLPPFKMVLDIDGDDANHDQDGWSINVTGVGIFGNRTTDEGAQYDYFVNSLEELVDQLNETSMFFSPSFTYYDDPRGLIISTDTSNSLSVVFDEVYVGPMLLDMSDNRCPQGVQYLVICEPEWTTVNPDQKLIDINSPAWSGYTPSEFYATNVYNSASELKLRIRRFNHDAVVSKTLNSPTLTQTSDSPWSVLPNVLNTFTANGTKEPGDNILERDFYEVCIMDPSISTEPQYFNIGNIVGRGDIGVDELNGLLNMIQVNLPENMRELDLNYFNYSPDDYTWRSISSDAPGTDSPKGIVATFDDLRSVAFPVMGDIYAVGISAPYLYYEYDENGLDQIYVDLSIDVEGSKLLEVSDVELINAITQISLDEVYVTEGLSDLGNTEPIYQSYLANLAIGENYFYPASTINSTNYLSIANSAAKLSQDSYKLYLSSPWDIDTGTLGWKFNAAPSTLYWEAVSRNKRNNSEFAPVFGQTNGIVQYQQPATEFNKKTRQLLLTKKINTVLWNNQTNAWNMNDNFTKQSTDTIMSDEGNSRLAVRISKAMPVLLRQFIGWKINPILWASAIDVIDYWIKFSILPMNYSIDDYRIQIDEDNNPTEIQRQNKMVVNLYVRYQRSLKYVLVYHDILDVGMDLA